MANMEIFKLLLCQGQELKYTCICFTWANKPPYKQDVSCELLILNWLISSEVKTHVAI